jgi:hypothetical protein
MCCGSKRSAWRSAPASTPQPRAAPTPPPVAPRPSPPAQGVDAKEAALLAPSPQLRRSAPQPETPAVARPARVWRLTS